ncbi:hypothetical protein GCM10010483_22490 [Actinokineospora diospyrosa]
MTVDSPARTIMIAAKKIQPTQPVRRSVWCAGAPIGNLRVVVFRMTVPTVRGPRPGPHRPTPVTF